MRKYITKTMICVFSAFALAGCGGGGGGGSSAASKAISKVYLFGNITSSSNIVATAKTTMIIPTSVLVNYSSAPGATTGLCKLRKGVLSPSGTVQVSASDFDSSSYDIASRVLTINMVNNGRVALKSSASGKGAEIATINFTLATPGITPTTMPIMDNLAEVGQETLATHATSYPAGSKTNFDTTYQ
jgi:hypothetical protein